MLRYGVVGTSWITESYIAAARLSGVWELAAVCSRSAEKAAAFAKKHGAARWFTDLEEMVNSGTVEAVYIASPNALHMAHCRVCVEAGVHVLCEKPLTAHPDELQAVQELAAQKGVVLAEAIMYMHLPAREALREAVVSIGRIGKAHFDFCQYSSKYPAYLRGETPNIFNPALETGALMDLGVYCVYPAVDLFGVPQRVSAMASFLDTGADGSGCAVLDYGAHQAVLTYSKIAQGCGVSEVVGDGGSVTVASISLLDGVSVRPRNGEERFVGHDDWSREQHMACEAEGFYKYITDPAAAERYAVAGRTALAVCRVMYEIRRQAGIAFPNDRQEE